MAIYAIGDLHLSLSADKPMDVFGERWENYVEKIKNKWIRTIKADDVVLLAGDTSWGISVNEALEDLKLINSLPGRKILCKGNHDYWWDTMSKLEKLKTENNLDSISFLFNNAFFLGNAYLCGTRGWSEAENKIREADTEKMIARESGRLDLSLKSLEKLKEEHGDYPVIAMFHYPAIEFDGRYTIFYEKIVKADVDFCIFGHLHGFSCTNYTIADDLPIKTILISADHLNYQPFLLIQ